MNGRKEIEMRKTIERVVTAVLAAGLLWIFASFIEVNCKNLGENPNYCPANFFVIINKF